MEAGEISSTVGHTTLTYNNELSELHGPKNMDHE